MCNARLFTGALLAGLLIPAGMAAPNGGGSPPLTGGPNPQPFRGIASTWAAGISVRNSNVGTSPDPILVKVPGVSSTAPAPWAPVPNVSVADYDINVLFPNHPNIDLDGFSAGQSIIERHQGNGVPDFGSQTAWLSLTASVSSGSQGLGGGHIRRVTGFNIDPGAELIGHYFKDSVGLGPGFEGSTLIEATKLELGYDINDSVDIDAIDYSIGMLTYNQNTAASTFFLNNQTQFYFTVSRDWANTQSLPFAYSTPTATTPTINAHPGDVYVMTWTGTTGQPWANPTVYLSHNDLAPNNAQFDLDAIDVDPGNKTLIFSATKESGLASQLMIFQEADPNAQKHVAGQSSRPLRSKAGLITQEISVSDNGDEITAVCSFDPELGSFSNLMGINASIDPTGTGQVAGISAVRGHYSVDPVTGQVSPGLPQFTTISAQVSEWGAAPTVLSAVGLFYRLEGTTAWNFFDAKLRLPTEAVTTFHIQGLPAPTGSAAVKYELKGQIFSLPAPGIPVPSVKSDTFICTIIL